MKSRTLLVGLALAAAATSSATGAWAQSPWHRAAAEVHDAGYRSDDDDRRRDYRHDRRDDRRGDRRERREDWRDDRRDSRWEHREDHRRDGWRDNRSHDRAAWEHQRRLEEQRRWQERQRWSNRGGYDRHRHSGYRFSRWSDVTPVWVNQYYGSRPGWSYSGGRWHADRSIHSRAYQNCHRPRIHVGHRYQPWNGYVDYNNPHVAWYRDQPDWVYVNGRQRPYYYDDYRSAYYTRDDNNAEILLGVAVAAVGLALLFGSN
ncbi:MAG: hypothetical protein MUF14_00955 [Hyphomonadaceae bacterium]|nr:hypothetical protein [Hyphomonadaceae bacterium]